MQRSHWFRQKVQSWGDFFKVHLVVAACLQFSYSHSKSYRVRAYFSSEHMVTFRLFQAWFTWKDCFERHSMEWWKDLDSRSVWKTRQSFKTDTCWNKSFSSWTSTFASRACKDFSWKSWVFTWSSWFEQEFDVNRQFEENPQITWKTQSFESNWFDNNQEHTWVR